MRGWIFRMIHGARIPDPTNGKGASRLLQMDFPGKKSVSTAQVKRMIKHPHKIHGTIVYLPTCMVGFTC